MHNTRTPIDWALFVFLSLIWASAYAFTRLAVSQDTPSEGFPPQLIIPVRLTIGAIILLVVAALSGQKWPPRSDWRKWLAMAAMGIVGTATPFFLITTAQKTVDSSLAALYVAASPLFVAILAHFVFHDERISLPKVLGIGVGFCGVAVLFGPAAFNAFESASAAAQAMCLIATFFYALSTIIARFAREVPAFIFAAGFVSFGAVATWPLMLSVDYASLAPSSSAIIGVIGLAIGPTALASVLYMVIVQRTNATFLSLTGYLIPVISAIIGYFAFKETHGWDALLAFILILSGVWLAQRSSQRAA